MSNHLASRVCAERVKHCTWTVPWRSLLPKLHPTGSFSSFSCSSCYVHTAGVRFARVLHKVCMAQCFCMLTVCFPRVQVAHADMHPWISTHTQKHTPRWVVFLLLANTLDNFAQLVFSVGEIDAFWIHSLKPLFVHVVPILQLPLELCENTGLFQCHGKKEMGLSERIRLWEHYKDMTFTAGYSAHAPFHPCCLQEFQSTLHFL